jgi:hypothetical protein
VQRGLGIIRGLVTIPTEEARARFPAIIEAFLGVAALGASSLVKAEALQTYEVSFLYVVFGCWLLTLL